MNVAPVASIVGNGLFDGVLDPCVRVTFDRVDEPVGYDGCHQTDVLFVQCEYTRSFNPECTPPVLRCVTSRRQPGPNPLAILVYTEQQPVVAFIVDQPEDDSSSRRQLNRFEEPLDAPACRSISTDTGR